PLDATRVKIRQQAEISIVGFETQKFKGKVQQISLLAGDNQNNNQDANNVKVSAIISLDEGNQNIVSGTPVVVTLIIFKRENVITIPNDAIQQNDSQTFVWMRDKQGKSFKKIIKIGLQGLDNIEVISGLKPGDEILIPILDNPLNEGDNVVIKIQ
ncbi:MAG: efflux RND transporter periplasmic adaptor subunit, partial [Dolichospermum sp.]